MGVGATRRQSFRKQFFGSGHCATRSPGWRNARCGVQ
ncbi:hypothetical protein A2U01_0089709, partial [Trifolium medium]|nr:hypothetical protein [Trifolium medium]